jgi:Fe-S oxidoreductase
MLGFTFYILVNTLDILEGYLPVHLHFWQYGIYRLLTDLQSAVVLAGIIYFMIRRFGGDKALKRRDNIKLHPKAINGINEDSLIVILFILGHVGFRLLGAASLIALHQSPERFVSDPWQPFANLPAWLIWGLFSPNVIMIIWHICWWLALGLILAFMPYFPYSKHIHLFMGPFNFATRPARLALGTLEPDNFEDESIEQFGAATLTDLSQKHIVDAFACIMCQRCQEVCPAYATGKELSPAALEINKRYHIQENFEAMATGNYEPQPLLDYAITESAVWACTSCGACIDVCPVGNEPMFDILNIRKNLVMVETEFPEQLRGAFDGMEHNANPWQMADDRTNWTRSLPFEVPTVEENPNYDVLFWVGCAGAFDPASQEIARAIATIMHEAEIDFAILGNDEICTGDTARRAGNEYIFYEMALANIGMLDSIKANERIIVTGCPHCLHSLNTEYPAYGGNYTVLHHTQLIAELIGQGKIRLNGNQLEHVTFHDPCYLGRHNGIVDDPRHVLAKAGAILLEMPRHGLNSFCCGAGGAQMWKEEEPGRQNVSINRYNEAKASGATTLAVGCPFCARMMNDANTQAGEPMRVKDVAQIVMDTMNP